MTIRKLIKVVSIGMYGESVRCYYDGKIVVNNGTRGVLFTGHDSPINQNGKLGESKYLPFQLIKSVEIHDYDGGMIVCNNSEFLSFGLEISEVIEKGVKQCQKVN